MDYEVLLNLAKLLWDTLGVLLPQLPELSWHIKHSLDILVWLIAKVAHAWRSLRRIWRNANAPLEPPRSPEPHVDKAA